MLVHNSTRFAAMAVLVGALACAGNTAREADTDETAAARDTTVGDTLGIEVQNPEGYRGMERDTTIVPPDQAATDTFLQNQGTGQAQDTAGYSGMEQVEGDTTGGYGQDTTGTTGWGQDTTTTGGYGQDTTTTGGYGQDTTSMTGQDTSWSDQSGDTTGYNPSQLEQDTASSR